MPSSAGGGVKERSGVVTPNENPGFGAFERAGAGVPKEKPSVLAAGLTSDCAAGGPNESPVGAPVGVMVEEPRVNPTGVIAGFSAVEGVVGEVPNVKIFLAGVESTAVAVSLAGGSKEKAVDNLGGLGASVRGAGSDTGINEGLCARENPDFNGSALSAAADLANFGKAKGVVVASAD
jgi:hypothetical protein